MAPTEQPVSDMLVTVKSREVQRGMLAEMRNDPVSAARHFLAAAHLEFVLAGDYQAAGQPRLARRSRLSAASCLWRAGRSLEAREALAVLEQKDPTSAEEVRRTLADLEGHQPSSSSA